MSGGKTLNLAPGTYDINGLTLSGGSSLVISPPGAIVINVSGIGGCCASKPIDLWAAASPMPRVSHPTFKSIMQEPARSIYRAARVVMPWWTHPKPSSYSAVDQTSTGR